MSDRPSDVVVRVHGVTKDYRGLRPLRIQQLELRQGQSLALLGLDEAMAEVLVNLLTAGILPDAGEVTVFGAPTSAIRDRDTWVRTLDRFGLVSARAVLLDQLTAAQNLAIPLSLDVVSMSDALRRDVERLADEVGIGPGELVQPVSRLPAASRLRIRLGRALALDPQVLLAEHPTATLTAAEATSLAADLSRIARSRGLSTLVVTADVEFARRAAEQVLTLRPATGELARPGVFSWLRSRV